MSVKHQIAILMETTDIQAVNFCVTVREILGVGESLKFNVILNKLKLKRKPFPTPKMLAAEIKIDVIREWVREKKPDNLKQNIIVQRPLIKAKTEKFLNRSVARNLPAKKELPKQRIDYSGLPYGKIAPGGGIGSVKLWDDGNEREYAPKKEYSFFDSKRVSDNDLDHCPHGIPKYQLCAICDPVRFRFETGID